MSDQAYNELEVMFQQLELENEQLKDLCADMFREHQRIYYTGGILKNGPSATSRQLAKWYPACVALGVIE